MVSQDMPTVADDALCCADRCLDKVLLVIKSTRPVVSMCHHTTSSPLDPFSMATGSLPSMFSNSQLDENGNLLCSENLLPPCVSV